MKRIFKQVAVLVLFTFLLCSCKKDNEAAPAATSINNTNWQVSMTVTGNTTTQNIFEFAGNGASFAWHPAAAASYTGSWSQKEETVSFSFKETTSSGDYIWDNTGILSSNNTVLTGTMQRRGAAGSGTFTAKKL